MTLLLVITAVAAERDALLAGLGSLGAAIDDATPNEPDSRVHVLVSGVGAAAAAAGTASALTRANSLTIGYDAVLNLGIAGAYPGRAVIGDTVIGTRSVAADLGAESPSGFLTMADLGFGSDTVEADHDLLARLGARMPDHVAGSILTVQTVTGTASRAADLSERHHDAVAEAMEGFGVATAARLHHVGFIEVRTVSNVAGPRDRAAWRIGAAMEALTRAGRALATLVG
jgi:futalosine hydrolase